MVDDTPGFLVAAVDDDQRFLESLQTLLESADYAVRTFASGSALLACGCLAKIDFLISDIDMPGMDGFELSRVVRMARPRLPIILITAHPAMQKLFSPIGLGDYRVFEKPFDGVEMLAAVAEALESTRAQNLHS